VCRLNLVVTGRLILDSLGRKTHAVLLATVTGGWF
jgi:hypothetical protein